MRTVLLQSVFTTDASLAFIFFIAFSLMVALGVRFALYAYLNLARIEIESQTVLWEYLLFVGTTGALYGALGAVEAATAVAWPTALVPTPYRDGVLLAFLLLIVLTIREIHDNDALTHANGDPASVSTRQQAVELLYVLLVTLSLLAAGVYGATTWLDAVEGATAIVFAAYGAYFGGKHLNRSSVQGTMIDSLLRHLLPVVTFTTLVLVVDLAIVAGLSVGVVRHIQVVFVIMTATTLMSSTIKLSQNVAGF